MKKRLFLLFLLNFFLISGISIAKNLPFIYDLNDVPYVVQNISIDDILSPNWTYNFQNRFVVYDGNGYRGYFIPVKRYCDFQTEVALKIFRFDKSTGLEFDTEESFGCGFDYNLDKLQFFLTRVSGDVGYITGIAPGYNYLFDFQYKLSTDDVISKTSTTLSYDLEWANQLDNVFEAELEGHTAKFPIIAKVEGQNLYVILGGHMGSLNYINFTITPFTATDVVGLYFGDDYSGDLIVFAIDESNGDLHEVVFHWDGTYLSYTRYFDLDTYHSFKSLHLIQRNGIYYLYYFDKYDKVWKYIKFGKAYNDGTSLRMDIEEREFLLSRFISGQTLDDTNYFGGEYLFVYDEGGDEFKIPREFTPKNRFLPINLRAEYGGFDVEIRAYCVNDPSKYKVYHFTADGNCSYTDIRKYFMDLTYFFDIYKCKPINLTVYSYTRTRTCSETEKLDVKIFFDSLIEDYHLFKKDGFIFWSPTPTHLLDFEGMGESIGFPYKDSFGYTHVTTYQYENIDGYKKRYEITTLKGFGYRVPINISVDGAFNNVLVNISVDTATLISQGKMRSDCADIRFTRYYQNGTEIPLRYSLLEGCNSGNTKIGIFFTSINESASVYMYYGNPNAVSKSEKIVEFGMFPLLTNFSGSKLFYMPHDDIHLKYYWIAANNKELHIRLRKDGSNYYDFSAKEYWDTMGIAKVVSGSGTWLQEDSVGYGPGARYEFEVIVKGNRLIYIDRTHNHIISVTDNTFSFGNYVYVSAGSKISLFGPPPIISPSSYSFGSVETFTVGTECDNKYYSCEEIGECIKSIGCDYPIELNATYTISLNRGATIDTSYDGYFVLYSPTPPAIKFANLTVVPTIGDLTTIFNFTFTSQNLAKPYNLSYVLINPLNEVYYYNYTNINTDTHSMSFGPVQFSQYAGNYTVYAIAFDSDLDEITSNNASFIVVNETGIAPFTVNVTPTSGTVATKFHFSTSEIYNGTPPYDVYYIVVGATTNEFYACTLPSDHLTCEYDFYLTDFGPGTYYIQGKVKDSAGRERPSSNYVTVVVYGAPTGAPLNVSLTVKPTSGTDETIFQLFLNISGGVKPYTVKWYDWSNLQCENEEYNLDPPFQVVERVLLYEGEHSIWAYVISYDGQDATTNKVSVNVSFQSGRRDNAWLDCIGNLTTKTTCGNGICEPEYGENTYTCYQDCYIPPSCGNGVCEPHLGETVNNCPQDCLAGNYTPPYKPEQNVFTPIINTTELPDNVKFMGVFLTPFMIANYFMLIISTAIGYYVKRGEAFVVSILVFLIAYTIYGIYPLWAGITLIIITGMIVAYMLRSIFYGG